MTDTVSVDAMHYHCNERDEFVRYLAESFPKCFFEELAQRRPLKRDIIDDLEERKVLSTTNWRTPPSEALRAFRVRLRVLVHKIRAENPNIDAAKATNAMMPGIQDEAKALGEEILEQAIEEELDATCFVYGPERRLMPDEELRRMSDRELVAWCERAGVMFAQVKAHLAAHYPETALKVIGGGKGE
jgi:hypothetical protein